MALKRIDLSPHFFAPCANNLSACSMRKLCSKLKTFSSSAVVQPFATLWLMGNCPLAVSFPRMRDMPSGSCFAYVACPCCGTGKRLKQPWQSSESLIGSQRHNGARQGADAEHAD